MGDRAAACYAAHVNPRPRRKPAARPPHRAPAPPPDRASGWDHVAAWYDQLVGDAGSDYHREVILPSAMRLLDPKPGERLLDVCCGQGVFVRMLLKNAPAEIVGVDASAQLIEAARRRGPLDGRIRYIVGDAARLGELADGRFDAAACIMAVQDVADLSGLFSEIAAALRPGGRVVIIMMHPCFRIPRQSGWGWDEAKKTQYRRIERYATPLDIPIVTHPGQKPTVETTFHHRPLAAYLNALGAAGLAVDACEELVTHRQPPTGRRVRGERRSHDEIPVFLALRATRLRGA